jgi:Holliday junction resolvase RusA-like endonuclease
MNRSPNVYELWIPIPPKAKGRARFTKSGIAYTPKETRRVETNTAWHCKSLFKHAPLSGAVWAEFTFYMPVPKRTKNLYPVVKPDCDNAVKLICDSANGILWKDDKQIVSLQAIKMYDHTGQRVGTHIRFGELL